MTLSSAAPGLPVERATTLRAPWYLDPAHQRLEIERIFKRTRQQPAPA